MLRDQKGASVFGESAYLSAFSTWDALILNDYEGGLPLPRRMRVWFKELYQPPFIQLCPWIGPINESIISDIEILLNKHFDRIRFNSNIKLNHSYEKRPNIILDLNQSIDDLRSNYRSDLSKNLRKKKNDELTIVRNPAPVEQSISETVVMYIKAYGKMNLHLDEYAYSRFNDLMKIMAENEQLEHIKVYLEDQCLASAFFVKGHGRLHYVMGAPSKLGKKRNALSILIDHLIELYAETEYILDFEGSKIESVAKFFNSFGSETEYFYEYSITPNRFLKLFWK